MPCVGVRHIPIYPTDQAANRMESGRNHPGCHAQRAVKNRPPRWREDGRHRKNTVSIF